jgi:ribonuclease HI
MKRVKIYTDGACSGNPGPGGWGAVLLYGERKKELSGGEERTTNNRMELRLSSPPECPEGAVPRGAVHRFQYKQTPSTALLTNWVRRGWRAAGRPGKDAVLWKGAGPAAGKHDVEFFWVKGHAENELNNRCDELAVAESGGSCRIVTDKNSDKRYRFHV